MKKSILAALGGIVLGVLIIVAVSGILLIGTDAKGEVVKESTSSASDSLKTESETVDMIETQVTENLTEMTEMTEVTEDVTENQNTNVSAGTNKINQHPYYIKVNRQANCVTIYTKDENGEYTVPVKAMVCSVGTSSATPLGVSKITNKYPWRLLFGNTYGQYTTRFNGHILFHSVPYMQMSKDTLKDGQYNLLGQPASQGCIRLSCADAKWIYDNCAAGTLVEVYDSPDPGPLGKPSAIKISDSSPYRGWDPTDPDPANPWKNGAVSISGVKDYVITQGEMINLLDGVSATDIDGLGLTVNVSGSVDTNVPGTYTVTYSATSVVGTTATATATVTVQATTSGENTPPTEDTENTENAGDTQEPENTPEPSEIQEASETQESSEN